MTITFRLTIDLFQQDKGAVRFDDKWPDMRPVVLKLLQQEPVTQNEWQDLFYAVHIVCLWDDQGPQKMRQTLKTDIMEFIKKAQYVRKIIIIILITLLKVYLLY